ncbi:MAG: hypothetical protein AB1485_00120 [Candidatus Thermoplasmatota archaeon]
MEKADAGKAGTVENSAAAKRELGERCPICGFPTIQKTVEFKEEELAVSACMNPKCSEENLYYDWTIPNKAKDEHGEIVDEELFEESSNWAKNQARKMREELFSHPIKIEICVSEADVDKFLDEKRISLKTRVTYRIVLRKFVQWLKKKEEPNPINPKPWWWDEV